MTGAKMQGVSDFMSRPPSARALETATCVVLAVWVFGEIVFVHSGASGTNWAAQVQPMQFVNALAAGCLIAVVAAKGLNLQATGAVGLCCLLLPAFMSWGLTKDVHLPILVLALLAIVGFDVKRVMRYLAAAQAAAIAVAFAFAFRASAIAGSPDVPGAFVGSYAFSAPENTACALCAFLLTASLASTRGSLARKILIAACVLLALVAAFPLQAKKCALVMVALGACLAADDMASDAIGRMIARKEVRWLVAAFPLAMLCLTYDAGSFFNLDIGRSAYVGFVSTFGFAMTACLAILHIRTVLLGGSGRAPFHELGRAGPNRGALHVRAVSDVPRVQLRLVAAGKRDERSCARCGRNG